MRANRIPRPNDRVWPATPTTMPLSASTEAARRARLTVSVQDQTEGGRRVSFIAWLDTSPEQQKRMREIVRLFEDTETIDELGIGQIRDTFSNLLFPGTSVLLTRARYYLFVPWAFQLAAERKKASPAAILTTAENYERSLIEAIRKSGDLEGLIGRQAGTKVRTLPSQIYWGGLASYGILAAGSPDSRSPTPPGRLTTATNSLNDDSAIGHRRCLLVRSAFRTRRPTASRCRRRKQAGFANGSSRRSPTHS